MMGPEPITLMAAGAFPQRRFAATRISEAVDADLRRPGGVGIVEGIHRSAVNLRWRGDLLTIAHDSMGGLPNGVLVDPPIALDQIGIAQGMPVQTDGATLRVPGASLVVFLSGAASWSPAMPVLRGLPLATRVKRAEAALALAADQAPRLGLGPLLPGLVGRPGSVGSLGRAAASSLAAVVEALGDRSPGRAVAAAFPLIGLGPGATPSGDDLLVGLAAGLAVTDDPVARPFAAGVAALAEGVTTSVAECYLAYAGRLQFSERVHVAALAILGGHETELPRTVTSALGWGASSGADLMVGLLVGMQADAPGLSQRLLACATEGHVAA
jgi:hypothetical protein